MKVAMWGHWAHKMTLGKHILADAPCADKYVLHGSLSTSASLKVMGLKISCLATQRRLSKDFPGD